MELRHVGRSGLVVSAIGLGCAHFGRNTSEPGRRVLPDEQAVDVIHEALDAGITLFDTSDSYGNSEEVLGRALQGHRDEIVLATKFGTGLKGGLGNDFGARGARRYVRRAIERSLRRLRTDRIDLYQIHRPDPTTPIAETIGVLDELVHEGKVCYVGSSNFAGWQIADAEAEARARGLERFVSAQNCYNLLDRALDSTTLPACAKYGIGLITWRPLANGLLTGKYHRETTFPETTGAPKRPPESTFDRLEHLERFAAARGVQMLELAIGGLLANAQIASVIAGATTPEQIRSNVTAAEWRPDPLDLADLDGAAA